MARYTQKQIDKHQRQKYIAYMEKMTKNLFRMFRNESTQSSDFVIKYIAMMEKFVTYENIFLDNEYHRQLQTYLVRIAAICSDDGFTHEQFEDMREAEMSNLNRLQKLKNQTSYKKEKHKSRHDDEY